jgi:hypothetical protein
LTQVLKERGFDEVEVVEMLKRMDDLDNFGKRVAEVGGEKALRELGDSRPLIQQPRAMKHFGGFDFGRVHKGTGWEKFQNKLPIIADPFDAALRFGSQAVRRAQLAEIVGKKGEMVDLFYNAVRVEAGEAAANNFRMVVYNYLDNKYYDQYMRKIARFATSANVMSKMSLSVFANMTQPTLTNMIFGTTASIKGLARAVAKGPNSDLGRIVAINHSILSDIGRLLGEESIAITGVEKVAQSVLKWSGFNAFERFNRVHAAATGQFVIRDTITKAVAGRLRGRNLQNSRRMMADMGLDLTRIVDDVKGRSQGNLSKTLGEFLGSTRWQKMETNAVFNAAKKTQFIPTKFSRPDKWNTPLGRIAFQFKTFALQQGRLLRDGVLAEAALGNVAPLARMVSINPIAAEVFADTKALVSGKERRTDPANLADRVLDDMLFLGGWGLATEMVDSAHAGDIAGFLAGPTFDTTIRMVTSVLTLNPDMALREFFKLPTTRATIRLFQLGHHLSDTMGDTPGRIIDEYMETLESTVDEGRRTMTLDQLVEDDSRSKQQ